MFSKIIIDLAVKDRENSLNVIIQNQHTVKTNQKPTRDNGEYHFDLS